jgi:branched-chain amino acid transport system permease protein
VSLGQIAFFALGACLGAKATVDWNLDLTLAFLVTGVAGALAAIVIGLPSLRLRGLYLAVTTFSFSLATTSYLLNRRFEIAQWIPTERIERQKLLGQLDIDSPTRMYYLALVVFVLVFLALRGIRHSRTGRALLALRENDRAAQAYAVDAGRTRLTAFALAGAIASIAGCLFVHHQQAIGDGPFFPAENFTIFTMVVVGGIASPLGALLGALFVLSIRYYLPVQYQVLANGAGVLLILLVLPSGLGGLGLRLRDLWLRAVAERHRLDAPGIKSGRLSDDVAATPSPEPVPVGGGG